MKSLKTNRALVIKAILVSLFLVAGFQNCSKVNVSDIAIPSVAPVEATGAVTEVVYGPLKIGNSDGFVCSAFGSITVPSEKSGLKTELRYLSSLSTLSKTEKDNTLSTEYFNDQNSNFIKAPETLYLSDVNVTGRSFSAGFTSADGRLLKDNQGATLFEYFGLKMESVLKLGANDTEGYYELSTISDDGTVLQIKENDQWVDLISNDGLHSNKMGCANKKIYFDKTTRVPIRIYYNQGPRLSIANVLLWNYRGKGLAVTSDLVSDENINKYCGKSSYQYYWSESTSAPGPWITSVFAANWKVLAQDNFLLPDNEVNPCAYSKYDLQPVVSAEINAEKSYTINLKSVDSTILTAKLYQIQDTQNKILIKSINQNEEFSHDFEIGKLDGKFKYQLEVSLELPTKKLKVLRVYNLSFQAI